jgi:hypothetical protein
MPALRDWFQRLVNPSTPPPVPTPEEQPPRADPGASAAPPQQAPPQLTHGRLVQGPQVDLHIVGEASYAKQVRAVHKRYGDREFEIVLRADPHNPYDSNAVAVLVDSDVVGYLARAMAAQWQPAILAAESEGFTVRGTACIFGGTPDKPNLGVFGSAAWPGHDKPKGRWG